MPVKYKLNKEDTTRNANVEGGKFIQPQTRRKNYRQLINDEDRKK